MAATVKNNAFLLGEATLMLAPYSDPVSVFELQPAAHSVGMVRNVQLSQESDEVELRKGIQQLLVDSKKSNVRTTLSAEVFEFSAQNVLYSLSLAKAAVALKRGKLKNAVSGASATIVVNTDPLPGEATSGISAVGDIPVGATVMLQVTGADNDIVLPLRVTATTTVTAGDYTITVAVPTGFTFPAGSKVWVVNEVPLNSTAEQDFFKMKVVGTLSNNERPLVLVFPKVKIKRGFQINFDEGNYTSMPFEFSPYFLSLGEATGRLAEIGTNQQGTSYIA
jgi:hypothetical protein